MTPSYSHLFRKYNDAGVSELMPREVAGRPHDILIPLEVDNEDKITGIFVLGDKGFPEGGQSNLFEYVGSHFDEGFSGLTFHRELDNQALQKGYTLTLLKLARSIDLSDLHTRGHGPRTSVLSRYIARELGLDAHTVEQIALAGMLHDVGKVVVPKSILTKPSRLTEEEWMVMRRHPTFAALIMEPCAELHALIPLVQSHHERFDGTGYPSGLSGNAIPVGARILALADAFTTMAEGRPYQPAYSVPETLEEITRCNHFQFDPKIVHAMMNLVARGEIDDILFWRNWRGNSHLNHII